MWSRPPGDAADIDARSRTIWRAWMWSSCTQPGRLADMLAYLGGAPRSEPVPLIEGYAGRRVVPRSMMAVDPRSTTRRTQGQRGSCGRLHQRRWPDD